MQHISFFLTQDQVKSRQKSVTRRGGWRKAKPGQLCVGVVKGQGLKPGERIEPLCAIQIVNVRREPLNLMIFDPEYGAREVRAEGFPEMTPAEFVAMYCEHNGGEPDQEITRIYFIYRDDVFSAYMREFAQPGNTPKEPMMAKDKPNTDKAPKAGKTGKGAPMDETQVKDEKGAVDAAFSKGAQERPGVPTDPAFEGNPEPGKGAPEQAVRKPAVPTYTHAIDNSEYLPAFQKIVFVTFSREDVAVRAEEMSACDRDKEQLEIDMAADVKKWKEKINTVEGKRRAISAQVTAKGEEREIECRKRINEETQEAIIFDASTLEIVEVKKLTQKELQTELQLAETHRAAAGTKVSTPKGAKLVTGNFPKDKVVGANAVENPEADRKNDDAVKALAGTKD